VAGGRMWRNGGMILLRKTRCARKTAFPVPFLGAFAKFRKATVSFAVFVRLSVRMEQLGSHWTDFDKI
jgi:hypothetical protein